ncbi:MAG: hypothetical protein IMF04_00545 [Proteobacteria bacterium]|nr:hypothetical protein [Pseudomonadota bacterium]
MAALLFSHISAAEEVNNEWEFELTPYLWATQLNGDVEGAIHDPLGNQHVIQAKIDLGFDDILDRLDKAFMGMFEVRNGEWTANFEMLYMKLSESTSGQKQLPTGLSIPFAMKADFTEQMYQASFGRRIFNKNNIDARLLAGARYIRLTTDIDIKKPALLIPLGSQLSTTKDWVDPFIGARVSTQISDNWSLVGYGDIGFSGMGSDKTYQAYLGAHWLMSERYSLKMGYRYIYQDYKDGNFVWDRTAKGPAIGLGIKF